MPSNDNRNKKKQDREAADKGHKRMVDATTKASEMNLGSESKRLLDKLQPGGRAIPPQKTLEIIRKLAVLSGTDVEMNDNDAYGDGDQSLVGVGENHDPSNRAMVERGEPVRQILRDLFSVGGDLQSYLLYKRLSPFALMCVLGNAKGVELALKQTAVGSEERMHLLERRETGTRWSPLLFAIATSKCKPSICAMTGAREVDMDHMKIIRILLLYGARPDCKELTGKTVVHYGAGAFASVESLEMTDCIVEAAKSSAHFGKPVILHNLKKEEYNGLAGTLGGFVAEAGRRQVTLDDGGKQLSLLPKNIFLPCKGGEEEKVCIYDSSRNLLNDYDRLGTTSMHEVYMSERVDVAEWLVGHNVSIDIGPVCGTPVRKMALCNTLIGGMSRMQKVVRKYISKLEKAQSNRCHGCNEIFEELFVCTRCKKASYCTRQCQVKHWRAAHKAECQVVDEECSIQLSRPDPSMGAASSSMRVSFERPSDVDIDERFYIKVQCNSEFSPHLVYDRSRSVSFTIMPGQGGHSELFKIVQGEKAFNGRKLYFKAAFGASNNLRVYPNLSSTTKKW